MAGRTPRKSAKTAKKAGTKPVLLSGGNPQIAKADGDAPVQAYIAAMPGWKSDVGRRLDDLIVRNVPNVRKAVRWNSPWYGIEGEGLVRELPRLHPLPKPESTEGGRRVSVLKRQEGAPVNLG